MKVSIVLILLQILSKCICQSNDSLTNYPWLSYQKDTTGPLTSKTRIIGGFEVTPHSYPFQVAINIAGQVFCGGTLVKKGWVLTAAHCLEGNPRAGSISVFLGRHNISKAESSSQIITVANYYKHNNWVDKGFIYDIALLKLSRNATLNNYVNTVTIASGNATYVTNLGTTVGWGKTESNVLSTVLRSVTSIILSNEECNNVASYRKIIAPSHICVSGQGVVGSCSGDSGGPLLVNSVQVGIVSFGYYLCNASQPSVYTRLTDYHEWIFTTIKNCSSCPYNHEYVLYFAFFVFVKLFC